MSLSDAAGMRLSRFGFLMGLYAENFLKLQRVFALSSALPNSMRSSVDDGLDLCVDILERHPYTLEIRLTYDMLDDETGARDPSAYLRYYMDARMAEVTHCYIGRNWHDVLGLDATARTVVGHRLKMNVFLSKWLDYLADLGHSPFTLLEVASEYSDKEVAEA
ncbi:DUF1249 domain-containing protein [Pseudomarimonas arenosa]|uniref:DUF1249 domain-containing protein n=1 Tax=Pseudomarimonas arenosa TaxID=2774145 RepID=A0AAW3ZJH0_9GAMM|nr:DUF1249 domain-containing protein [Pseudomarimonas arenosa]MBD8525312.1 DUF1249 domain-containing protein [Pseudomarimonas arenosa]